MLVVKDPQQCFLETMLLLEILELNKEQAIMDVILNDDRFLEPFLKKFKTTTGRPTTSVESMKWAKKLAAKPAFSLRMVRESVNAAWSSSLDKGLQIETHAWAMC
jgi:hypothetical protein